VGGPEREKSIIPRITQGAGSEGACLFILTDTEVIVHLYEEYGNGCVDHMRVCSLLRYGCKAKATPAGGGTGWELKPHTMPKSMAASSSPRR